MRIPTRTRPQPGQKTRRSVNDRRKPAARPRKPATQLEVPDESPAPVLSASRRKELRAQAHPLQPLIQVGHAGVQPAVIVAVSRALRDHELIKVRLHEPEDKHGMAEALAAQSRAALCGLIGHTVILYKPKPATDSPETARRAPSTKRGRRIAPAPPKSAAKARVGGSRTSRA
jgi:RNA-binding protein